MKNKTMMLALSAVALIGSATGSFAAKTTISPFSDTLRVQFQGFPMNDIIYGTYVDNNGIDITGPDFIRIVQNQEKNIADVNISSKNKVAPGNPSMTLEYPTIYGTQTCTFNFVDGPWVDLNFENGVAPTCSGILVGNIVQKSLYHYTLLVTDSEP